MQTPRMQKHDNAVPGCFGFVPSWQLRRRIIKQRRNRASPVSPNTETALPRIGKYPMASPYFIGLDVGGTTMKAGVVDDSGRVFASVSVPTEAYRGQEFGLARMCEAIG